MGGKEVAKCSNIQIEGFGQLISVVKEDIELSASMVGEILEFTSLSRRVSLDVHISSGRKV